MASFKIPAVTSQGIRQLSSGDATVTFHVDRSKKGTLVPLLMIPNDVLLELTVSDFKLPEKTAESGVEQADPSDVAIDRRTKKYARIQILADENGYTEEKMRAMFKRLTGEITRTKMTDTQLDEVIKHLVAESEPPREDEENE